MISSQTLEDAHLTRPGDRWRRLYRLLTSVTCATVLLTASPTRPRAQTAPPNAAAPSSPTFADAQRLFLNSHYVAAAELAMALQVKTADAAYAELRSSALLFQLKALLEGPPGADLDKNGVDKLDKKEALKHCVPCPELITAFKAEVERGQTLARAQLRANPNDESALFLLGKLDLNYVWLVLGPLGQRTGWDEYWEARRSLDAVLKINPQHVRAMVARAWVDYIVDTKMPFGTKWILGGGNKKKALVAIRLATRVPTDFYAHAESEFALWNILLREHQTPEATVIARRLALTFPENPELAAYLKARAADKP